MPSFTTFFRAIVMLAAAVVVVKGWQHYGPSASRMKAFTAQAVERTRAAWNESQQPGPPDAMLTTDPRGAAPPVTAPLQQPSHSLSAAPLTIPSVAPVAHEPVAPAMFSESAAEETPPQASDRMPAIPAAEADRLPALLARLEALGGVDPQLVEWGSGGQLYRFCCRATLSDTPTFSRHFESVAAEPLVAVEEVVAKVEAWRTAQASEGSLR